ncbi:hypothetical protein [Agromyces sp. NPDC058064]|uniref:hypothetical protein n=1 Tax=Agromyces sp. NPDC058064 TaxID=3346322 RepID=UPI0036DE2BBD
MGGLPLIGAKTIHLDKNTFMWVQTTHFGSPPADDRSALAALIASPGYAFDYAVPYPLEELLEEELERDRERLPSSPPVHGRWWLSEIRESSFRSTTAGEAEARIRSWADDQDWADPGYRQPPEVHERLQWVHNLLRLGTVYTLNNPGDEGMHDYGFTPGELGFHEFVVVDRRSNAVHLIVASDD